MFVSQIDIKEFRGIRECREPIKLSKFTVLIGRNNSGKSTVLEALSLLPHSLSTDSLYGTRRIDILDNLHSGKPLVYKYAGVAELNYLLDRKQFKFKIPENKNEATVSVEGTILTPTQVAESMKWVEIEKLVLFIPNDTEILTKLRNRIEELWDLIVKLGAHISVVKHINDCIDEAYTEIFFEKRISVRKEAEKPYYIRLEDLGDGIEKAIKVMLFLEAMKPKLILWDDFEASAHPTLIEMLLKWLSERDWQVVLSTHSIDVLYRLLEVKPDDLTVLQLRRTPDDVLLHKSLSLEELESLIEANLDPRLLVDALSL